jgi:two-component system phosphate regulon sensor histidine kinase PhoR
LVAWLTSTYPQFLASFMIICLNVFYITFSLWTFDTYYFWIPIMAPAIVSFVTYITFLSFQLTLKEYLNEQLEKEHQFLLDVEELKNNFLSLISHDLKTPIAKIQAIVDRLIAQYPGHEFAGDLTSLREVTAELHRYIRTILQIARVESRDFRINKDSADINEIIETVVEQLDPLARNKKMVLKTNLEPMFLIEVDHILMHEVILNLIENAIKYTPEGGHVEVSSQEVDGNVIIMVEDSGPGIPESEQARVFEKFYRGELGKSQPKGSGLGLYLVKYFIELHAGKVLLDSSPKGTKIGFSLPVGELSTEISAVGESHEVQT